MNLPKIESNQKILVALDFDHTIVDDNTDTKVVDLIPDKTIPADIKKLYSSENWTVMMDTLFSHLHEQGRSIADLQKVIHSIPLAPGMRELFDYMREQPRLEVIIISDSNSMFIEWLLQHHSLHVTRVYTNPAHVDADGKLRVKFYHRQDWCKLSTINMCKGHILNEHQRELGASRTVYVGDGGNDLCPALRLKAEDVVCARTGYTLERRLAETEELSARDVIYSSGVEVKALLQQMLSEH